MICCSAYPTLMMCAHSVLVFIFMMTLFMRCLTFFMRCSLHENGGVCSYFIFIQQVYTKLGPTGIPVDFSLIVYNIQFTTSKHNFWFITSSYSSHFSKISGICSASCFTRALVKLLFDLVCDTISALSFKEYFLLRSFSFYGNNIWHLTQAFFPPNGNIRSLIAYSKRYPL